MIKKNKYIFVLFLSYTGILLLQLNFVFIQGVNKKDIFFNIFINLVCVTSYLIYFIKTQKKIYLSIATLFSFIPLLLLISILTNFTYSFLYFLIGDNNLYYLINCIVEIILVSSQIKKYYAQDYLKQWDEFTFNLPINIIKVLIYYVLSLYMSTLAFFIVAHFNLEEVVPANQQIIDNIIINSKEIYFYILIVFIAPFVEEFFFRYLLIEKILFYFVKDKDNLTAFETTAVLILSTGIFAFLHAFAATSLLYFIRDMIIYSSLSVVLSLAYIKERNIYINILIHTLNNFISVI